MMVYVGGDLHGDQNKLYDIICNNHLTKDDILIIAGDFGFLMRNNYAEERFIRDFAEHFDFTLAFVSGNHENHPAIAEFPVCDWCGGKAQKIWVDNVIHLMNGEIYEIQGHKVFVMGGAYSVDRAMRSATKWLCINKDMSVIFERSTDEGFDHSIRTITARDSCYTMIDALYNAFLTSLKEQSSNLYDSYAELRYSNIDDKKIRQARKIEEILTLPSSTGISCDLVSSVIKKYIENEKLELPLRFKLDEGSWWKEELPSDNDYKNAINNLKRYNMKVDYILTHTMPYEIILRYGKHPDQRDRELTGFLDWVMYECDYKIHYCGHWHDDFAIDDKHIIALYKIHRL